MTRVQRFGKEGRQPDIKDAVRDSPQSFERILESLQIDLSSPERLVETLPFSLNDTTAGTENELQAAVLGRRRDVDLAIAIERSNFYADILRRMASGEATRGFMNELESFLDGNQERVWENSWVRFPIRLLHSHARQTLESDLLADKKNPAAGPRGDTGRFLFRQYGDEHLRIPISYLIKLSLADVLGSEQELPDSIRETGNRLLDHFSNDNTSPETYSFHVVPLRPESGMGKAIARETAKRFLLTQLLVMYANAKFRLTASGQRAVIYAAPTTPVRQKELNACISDAFYRELFMSPCLSGWDKGEEKHAYMALCHQVLSRSQLNAVAKLREAGIITRNLVILPSMSNTSLANNGTHLSLGSMRISRCLGDEFSGFGRADEKYVGDLVIKIAEHFMPLFVGTYSAAPYRLDFCDFHPEKALAFLPHELDYTHLRMIWRRWKKKAHLKVFGRPITPFGPPWLDRLISLVLGLKGDFIGDFRLIDYFVALMSTDKSPALDGRLGNGERLKSDLSDLGVFDKKMALYLLYRLREYHVMGFSGFEGRHYSLFESLADDLSPAADLQTLINALAFKLIAQGRIDHSHIPDTPFVESERRQIFFGRAIGIPTFFVRCDTPNHCLRQILKRCRRIRASRRYSGYLRVYHDEYCKALLEILREDAHDLIEALQLDETIKDLERRLADPEKHSAWGKLTGSILKEIGAASAISVNAKDFNLVAEDYYRGCLRRKYLEEGLKVLEEDLRKLDAQWAGNQRELRDALHCVLLEGSAVSFLLSNKDDVLEETIAVDELRPLIGLVLISIHGDLQQASSVLNGMRREEQDEAPIHRAADW